MLPAQISNKKPFLFVNNNIYVVVALFLTRLKRSIYIKRIKASCFNPRIKFVPVRDEV